MSLLCVKESAYLKEKKTLLHHFSNCVSGCGSVLNIKGEVEMDAFVMDGKTLGCGAVSAVRNIANPIQLARLVMDKVCLFAVKNAHMKKG